MSEVIFLDSTPLWLLCLSKNSANPERDKCLKWLADSRAAGKIIVVPEITDYEVRREFIRSNLKQRGQWAGHLQRLDQLKSVSEYVPITTEMMLKAAEFWADLRNRGLPTADHKALDGDMILAAQAVVSDRGRNEVIVATKNPSHLARVVAAKNWWEIS